MFGVSLIRVQYWGCFIHRVDLQKACLFGREEIALVVVRRLLDYTNVSVFVMQDAMMVREK